MADSKDDPCDDWSDRTTKIPIDPRGPRELDKNERKRSIERSKSNGATNG